MLSPWDNVAPLPVPTRAYGRSQRTLDAGNSRPSEAKDAKKEKEKVFSSEISESIRLEMEYNADRAWYDTEEGNTDGETVFDL